jgi:hypothetical protein
LPSEVPQAAAPSSPSEVSQASAAPFAAASSHAQPVECVGEVEGGSPIRVGDGEHVVEPTEVDQLATPQVTS